MGTIATWTQQADSSTAVVNTLSYDGADQLASDVQSGGATASNAYRYDPAGNRLAETTLTGTTAGQFNHLNQLTGLSGSTTAQTVAGYTSAPASGVSINAVPATMSNSTNFTALVPLPSGTNAVSVAAAPSTGTTVTQRYQIVTTGTAATALTYDANGNTLTDENGNSYQWDALNRMTKSTYSSGATSSFAYDGLSRRTQIVEKNSSGTVTSTKNYLWIGQEMAEERNASNNVTKRFYSQGEQQSGTNYYYTRDHLGSVREMTNSSGTIIARYSYDPYGRTTLVSGTDLATFQYADLYAHHASGLELPYYRGAYDPNAGRWIQRDHIGEGGGSNLYDYVRGNPISLVDPLGLSPSFDINITPHFGAHPHVDIRITDPCCKHLEFKQYTMSSRWPIWTPDNDGQMYYPSAPDLQGHGITSGGDAPGFGVDDGSEGMSLSDRTTAGANLLLFGPIFGTLIQEFTICAVCTDGGSPKVIGCRHFWTLDNFAGGFGIGGGSGLPSDPNVHPPN